MPTYVLATLGDSNTILCINLQTLCTETLERLRRRQNFTRSHFLSFCIFCLTEFYFSPSLLKVIHRDLAARNVFGLVKERNVKLQILEWQGMFTEITFTQRKVGLVLKTQFFTLSPFQHRKIHRGNFIVSQSVTHNL